MLPVPMMDSWSLYVVDVEERTLLAMDPCETSEPEEEMRYKHEDNANFVLEGFDDASMKTLLGGTSQPMDGGLATTPSCMKVAKCK